MPIYEYRCQQCGEQFEKLIHRQAEESELACPKCGERELKRELSTFAAHTHAKPAAMPRCPSSGGMCPTPGACGMN